MRYNRYRSHGPPLKPMPKEEPEVITDVEVVSIPPPRSEAGKKDLQLTPRQKISNLIKRLTDNIDFEDLLLLVLILIFMSEDNSDDDLMIPILIYIYMG